MEWYDHSTLSLCILELVWYTISQAQSRILVHDMLYVLHKYKIIANSKNIIALPMILHDVDIVHHGRVWHVLMPLDSASVIDKLKWECFVYS